MSGIRCHVRVLFLPSVIGPSLAGLHSKRLSLTSCYLSPRLDAALRLLLPQLRRPLRVLHARDDVQDAARARSEDPDVPRAEGTETAGAGDGDRGERECGE